MFPPFALNSLTTYPKSKKTRFSHIKQDSLKGANVPCLFQSSRRPSRPSDDEAVPGLHGPELSPLLSAHADAPNGLLFLPKGRNSCSLTY